MKIFFNYRHLVIRAKNLKKNHYTQRETELGSLIVCTSILMDRILVRKMMSLTPQGPTQIAQGGLLHAIYDGKEYSIHEIMQITHKERSSITRLIGRMVENGYIVRRTISGSRKIFISITEKGKKVFYPESMDKQFYNIFGTLNEEEKSVLERSLLKVLEQELALLHGSVSEKQEMTFPHS
jgi:DNA-binding MarR family transcriptional regulator